MIRTIALSKLIPSPRNVRRASDKAADLQLKADIEARGLLQNLAVAAVRNPRGSFTVEAGGSPLQALNALANEGKLAADHEVCCLVLGDGGASAREASLAPFGRAGGAYRRLATMAHRPERIATRFSPPSLTNAED